MNSARHCQAEKKLTAINLAGKDTGLILFSCLKYFKATIEIAEIA